ncbi:MAG: hypothetical protein ACLP81_07150 [Acidimicrobiales bacterium]
MAKATGQLAGKQNGKHDEGGSLPAAEAPGRVVPSGHEGGRKGFQPSPVEAADVEAARSKREKIWNLTDDGLTPSQINAVTKLKVLAIRQVLGEARPGKESTVGAGEPVVRSAPPEGAFRSAPTGEARSSPPESMWDPTWPEPGAGPTAGALPRLDPGSGWDYVPGPVEREVAEALRNLGAKGNLASFIVKRWSFSDMTAERLEQIVLDSGAPGSVARSARRFVEERAGTLGHGGTAAGSPAAEDPLSKALSTRRVALAHRLEEAAALAAISQAEREARWEPSAQGPPRASDGESEKIKALEARIAELTEDRHRKELDDVRAESRAGIERLRAEFGHRSKSMGEVEVEEYESTVRTKAKGQTAIIEEGADRLKTAPHLAEKIDKLADMALNTPLLERQIQGRVATALEGDPTVIALRNAPTPDEQQAAEMLMRATGQGVPPDMAAQAAASQQTRRFLPTGQPFGETGEVE